MAIVSVEIGTASLYRLGGAAIHGRCLEQEAITIGGAASTAVSAAIAAAGGTIARVQANDTACYVAMGETPDPAATIQTAATTARRLLPAGAAIDLEIGGGMSVKAAAVS